MNVRVITLALLLGFGPRGAFAQSVDAGLTAEAEGRWDEAIRVYQAAIEQQPARPDLWVRIADIEAVRGNIAGCVAALQRAAQAAPGDAAIYFRLSQAYSTAGQPGAALNAIEGALALQPNTVDFLRARAILSTWLGDYRRAQDSYRRIAAVGTLDSETTLAFARVSGWAGDTNEAVKQYERYLHDHPEVAEAWIELARNESWRGNYGGALQALAGYRARIGETAVYSETFAAVMAGAGRPTRAEDLVEPLLAETPDNLQLNLTRTLALAIQGRRREAWSSLDTVRLIAPDSRDARNAERVVRSLIGSSAAPTFSVYSDSDRLEQRRFAPYIIVGLMSGTQLSAGYERTQLEAQSGSGLDQLDGARQAEYVHSWVGVAQKFGRFTLGGDAGYAQPGASELATYRVAALARATDSLTVSAERTSGAVVISPRTVGLGLTQIAHRAQAQWAPTLQSVIVFDALAQDFSDGNQRVELTLSPRRSVARTAGFNLDLGLSAYRLQTRFDFDNGYYDPQRYEHYAVTAFPYFKFRENVGLSLSSAVGAQRDSSTNTFRFGGTVGGELTLGIYEPWVLKVNGSASMNRRLESGAFRGISGGAVLVRRF
jgi:tetratricopeptide (TPR) repeat protein